MIVYFFAGLLLGAALMITSRYLHRAGVLTMKQKTVVEMNALLAMVPGLNLIWFGVVLYGKKLILW